MRTVQYPASGERFRRPLAREIGLKPAVRFHIGGSRQSALRRGRFDGAGRQRRQRGVVQQRLGIALAEESVELFRRAGYNPGVCRSLVYLAHQLEHRQEYYRAATLLHEAREIGREHGSDVLGDNAAHGLARLAQMRGDYEEAIPLLEDLLASARRRGWIHESIVRQNNLAEILLAQGNAAPAMELLRESMELWQQAGLKLYASWTLDLLGIAASNLGEYEQALDSFKHALLLNQEQGAKRAIAEHLAGLGGVALGQGHSERGARLLGAAKALIDTLLVDFGPADKKDFERNLAAARDQLGEEALTALLAEGRAMGEEQAVAYALESDAPETTQRPGDSL